MLALEGSCDPGVLDRSLSFQDQAVCVCIFLVCLPCARVHVCIYIHLYIHAELYIYMYVCIHMQHTYCVPMYMYLFIYLSIYIHDTRVEYLSLSLFSLPLSTACVPRKAEVAVAFGARGIKRQAHSWGPE